MNSWQNRHIKTGFYDPSCVMREKKNRKREIGDLGGAREKARGGGEREERERRTRECARGNIFFLFVFF